MATSTTVRPTGGLPAPGAGADTSRSEPAARSLARLRWRCRRGKLENDLILERFLDARGEGLGIAELAALERLLELGDDELWDLLSGRTESPDVALGPLLAALRAA